MTLPVLAAKAILRQRLGAPVKEVKYVVGFRTATGRVLALHPEQQETRLWYQPPEAPSLPGVRRIPSAKNADLNGPVAALASPETPRVEIADADALQRFIDWYAGSAATSVLVAAVPRIDAGSFAKVFARFQELVVARSGHPFTSFDEGLAAAWESYKPRLREYALELLGPQEWSENEIGSGTILKRMIHAIEIQATVGDRTNNLVFWQNRYGHANRDHRTFLEAATNPKLRRDIEGLLFGLFRGGADEDITFDNLRDLTGTKYPLLAYIFFLKDMDRFMPIQPTGFDRAFRALGIGFSTLRQCSWANYSTFNETLGALRPLLAETAGLTNVRLIDAHSFCWIFATLLKLEAEGSLTKTPGRKDEGRVLSGREKSIIAMRLSVENTVKNSNGQLVQRTVKNKELRMTSTELEKLIASLLDLQDNRCALTGIPFNFIGPSADKNLLPSLDRIDSNAHYEVGNLQVVCQFVNFWKGAGDNEEFRRLLMLVRGEEVA